MKRPLLLVLLALLTVFTLLSCQENLAYNMIVVNNSSRAVETIDLWYTGIKMAAPNFSVTASVPAGSTKTVQITLDSETAYYRMQISDITTIKHVTWYENAALGEYVLLRKGGSSICTITDDQATCTAGENLVVPLEYSWMP